MWRQRSESTPRRSPGVPGWLHADHHLEHPSIVGGIGGSDNRIRWVLFVFDASRGGSRIAGGLLYENEPLGEGDTALLEGIVALENGCFTVVDDAGQVIVPVLPTDFTWHDEAGELSGFGHTFSAGDSVSLG